MPTLDPEARKMIETEVRKQVWKLLTGAVAVIGLGPLLSVFTWVPSQAARLVLSDPALQDVRDRILRDSGALEGDTKRLRGVVDSASKQLDELSSKIAELRNADASKVATTVAALNSLGDNAKQILEAVERIRAEIPKGVRVSYSAADHMGWGNKNAHQHFCPQRGPDQVMVSGAIGVGNGDFSVACGRIELVR